MPMAQWNILREILDSERNKKAYTNYFRYMNFFISQMAKIKESIQWSDVWQLLVVETMLYRGDGFFMKQ